MGSAMVFRAMRPNEPEWARLLTKCRHDFYHLPGYVALEGRRVGGTPRAFVVTEGEDFALLPLIIRPVPSMTGSLDGTSPYGYPGLIHGGPRADDPAWLRRAISVLLGGLASERVASVFVRLHPLLNQRWDVLREFGDVVEQGETVAVDLTLTEDQLFGQMRMNHRRVIRRLRSLDITARVDDDWDQLDDFVRIYHETMKAAGAAPWYFFPRRYFEELREAVGPSLMLKLVERRGELLAAGIFGQCNGLVQYHLGATSSAARSLSPSRLMLYAACEWGKEQGNMLLHLGGGVQGRPDSLFHFKAGFSPLRARFATWRVVTLPSVFEAATLHWEATAGKDWPYGDAFFPPYRRASP